MDRIGKEILLQAESLGKLDILSLLEAQMNANSAPRGYLLFAASWSLYYVQLCEPINLSKYNNEICLWKTEVLTEEKKNSYPGCQKATTLIFPNTLGNLLAIKIYTHSCTVQ